MAPDHHDLVLAITSHLPHLIAYTIVGTADELQAVTRSEVLNSRPAVSATSPASLHPTQRCGATCSLPTRTPFSKCLVGSMKMFQR
jgi:hypothetical protein